MKILRVVLETLNIEAMKMFYRDVLEMPMIREKENFFTVKAGQTHLTFLKSEKLPFYHFALRTNLSYFECMYEKLLKNKVELLPDENGQTSLYWKGQQVYFKDPDGNILEILERKNPYGDEVSGWYDVCEVGMPSGNVQQMSDFLHSIPADPLSDSETFRFYGNESGNFVLVKEGRHWYPTNQGATIHPISVEVEGSKYEVLKHPTLPYTIKVKEAWATNFPAVQFRIARPTDKFNEIISFYEEGLGLQRIGGFTGHDGYDGVMFGLPNANYHIEFTSHVDGTPCPAPTKDNLLVFYMPDWAVIESISKRLAAMGYRVVEAENPYWDEGGITIEDPDGWRIVLYCSTGL